VAQATISVQLDAQANMALTFDAGATAGVSTSDPASASGSVNGCVDIGAGMDVNIGASADFFGLFDPSTKVIDSRPSSPILIVRSGQRVFQEV
jgi:hypothetical protein